MLKYRIVCSLAFLSLTGLALVSAEPQADVPVLNFTNRKAFFDGKGSSAQIVKQAEVVRRQGKDFVVHRDDRDVVATQAELESYLRLMAYRTKAIPAIYWDNPESREDNDKLSRYLNDPAHRGETLVVLGEDPAEITILEGKVSMLQIGYSNKLIETREVPLALMTSSLVQAGYRGDLKACGQNLKNLATALELYSTDNRGHYPPHLNLVIGPAYLTAMPTCPSAGRVTYDYTVSAMPDNFTLVCKGHYHADAHVKADNPRYTAAEGLSSEIEAPSTH